MEVENNNLQLKLDIIQQAESLKDSNDWKKTGDALIQLQKKWKTIGPVPRRVSDKIWNRFRAACNEFFDRRKAHFSSLEEMLEDNIKIKEDLIKAVEEYQLTGNIEADLKQLKTFQKNWSEVGHVPNEKRGSLQNRFRTAVNKQFEQLKLADSQKEELRFKMQIESILQENNSKDKLYNEREILLKKLNRLESDISIWENNLGFFAQSKNADALLKDFHHKIENGKKSIQSLKEKIKIIDNHLFKK